MKLLHCLKVKAKKTSHVKRHTLISSEYAITLINLMCPKDLEQVRKEIKFQIELMKSV